jgi:hypothetical protein
LKAVSNGREARTKISVGKGKDVGLGRLVGALEGLGDLIDGTAKARIAASIHDGRGASVGWYVNRRKKDGAWSGHWG